jgi:hypothetical protein
VATKKSAKHLKKAKKLESTRSLTVAFKKK